MAETYKPDDKAKAGDFKTEGVGPFKPTASSTLPPGKVGRVDKKRALTDATDNDLREALLRAKAEVLDACTVDELEAEIKRRAELPKV